MREITGNIKIVYGMIALDVGIARRNDPALDRSIVACGTDFGLGRTSASSKDNRSDNIEMSAKGEFDPEDRWILLPGNVHTTIMGILGS